MQNKGKRPRSIDTRLRLVGHPLALIGMGEHLRSVWRSLSEVGFQVGLVDIGLTAKSDPVLGETLAPAMTDSLGGGINIFVINGDEVSSCLKHLEHRNAMADGSYNIVFPAWELELYPKEWAAELNRFDEVWAASVFTRDSIAASVDVPVVHMPLACEVQYRTLRSRRRFAFPDSSFVFFVRL